MQVDVNEEIESRKLQITKLSKWLWGDRIREPHIDHWLNNFESIEEKKVALSLLSQFMFYDLREVRQGLKAIFNELYILPKIHQYRKKTDSYNILEYEKLFREELKNTKFLMVGNPSESSSLLLYFFRQINDLPKDSFIESCKLFSSKNVDDGVNLTLDNKNVSNIVFIDDLSGSGDQASRELNNLINTIRQLDANTENNILVKLKRLKWVINNPSLTLTDYQYQWNQFCKKSIKIYYFTLFATTKALRKLRESELFDTVESIFELDETYKVFSDESRYLNDELKRLEFQSLCIENYHTRYNAPYIKDGECGYKDSQLMLGFFYNIPNNTLPMFWAESEKWVPLFKRYDKNYKLGI